MIVCDGLRIEDKCLRCNDILKPIPCGHQYISAPFTVCHMYFLIFPNFCPKRFIPLIYSTAGNKELCALLVLLCSKKVKQSRYRPRGFQEVKVPRFHDNVTGLEWPRGF